MLTREEQEKLIDICDMMTTSLLEFCENCNRCEASSEQMTECFTFLVTEFVKVLERIKQLKKEFPNMPNQVLILDAIMEWEKNFREESL